MSERYLVGLEFGLFGDFHGFIGEVKNVLFSIHIGQERTAWDNMDSGSFGEEAAEESSGGH